MHDIKQPRDNMEHKIDSNADIHTTLGIDGSSARHGGCLRKIMIWGGLALITVAAALFLLNSRGKHAAPAFKTQPVTRGNLVVTVTATGNLASTSEVEVGSELSGIIRTVTVDYNDSVKEGQPLAYLDSTKFEAAVMKSRATLASAKATLREAQATLREKDLALTRKQTARKLTHGKMPSIEEMDTAEAEAERAQAAVGTAQAAILQAEADLKSNETDLEKTVIYSPINGIVLDRSVEPGQTVAASLQAPVLFTLAGNLAHMELQVDVDEADVGQVHAGQEATFTVDAYPDETFTADITQVRYGSETTDDVVTYKTILNLENPGLLLRPGMTATAEIIVRKVENALLVPNAALRFAPPQMEEGKDTGRRGLIGAIFPRPRRRTRSTPDKNTQTVDRDKKQVWILTENHPEPVTVTIGMSDGTHTVISEGHIDKGMEVVVDTIDSNE